MKMPKNITISDNLNTIVIGSNDNNVVHMFVDGQFYCKTCSLQLLNLNCTDWCTSECRPDKKRGNFRLL